MGLNSYFNNSYMTMTSFLLKQTQYITFNYYEND